MSAATQGNAGVASTHPMTTVSCACANDGGAGHVSFVMRGMLTRVVWQSCALPQCLPSHHCSCLAWLPTRIVHSPPVRQRTHGKHSASLRTADAATVFSPVLWQQYMRLWCCVVISLGIADGCRQPGTLEGTEGQVVPAGRGIPLLPGCRAATVFAQINYLLL